MKPSEILDQMAEEIKNLIAAMRNYEMGTDDLPPFKHKEMMKRAESTLTAYKEQKADWVAVRRERSNLIKKMATILYYLRIKPEEQYFLTQHQSDYPARAFELYHRDSEFCYQVDLAVAFLTEPDGEEE